MPEPAASLRPVIIIPARLGSTRFPEKVLASETGKPLIQHVWESASRATGSPRVVIAADDTRIKAAAAGFGAECILTRVDHPNGTSRLAEAAAILGLAAETMIVNVQGDEPELDSKLINAAVQILEQSGAPVSTVATPFGPGERVDDPHIVKVVRAADGTALYFSRAAIPHARDGTARVRPLRHIGLYCYRRSFLDRYTSLPVTDLEQTEQLEQLRILYHGFRIAVAVCEASGFAGIDTPEQYQAFVKRWQASRR